VVVAAVTELLLVLRYRAVLQLPLLLVLAALVQMVHLVEHLVAIPLFLPLLLLVADAAVMTAALH
jgi:hypothetical protein